MKIFAQVSSPKKLFPLALKTEFRGYMTVHKTAQPVPNVPAGRRQRKHSGFPDLRQGQLHAMLLKAFSELFCKLKASCCEAYVKVGAVAIGGSGLAYTAVSIKDPSHVITKGLIWDRIAECQPVALIRHDAQANKEGKQGLVVLSGSPNPTVAQTGLSTFLDGCSPGACYPCSQIIVGGVKGEAVAGPILGAPNTQVAVAGHQPNEVGQ